MSEPKTAFPVALPKSAPGGLRLLMLVLILAGGGVFATALASDPARAWRAFLISALFFTGLGLAGVVWSAATRLSNGRFARPVLRIMEGLGSFVPVGCVLLAVFILFGARHVYPWIHEVYKPHPFWLQYPNVAARDLFALAVLMIFDLVFLRTALVPDLAALKDKAPEHLRGMYRGWAGNFGGSDIEVERHRKTMLRMSPAAIILYAVIWSLISFDLIMSLDMEWSSTMFGGIVFMGAFLGAIALVAIISTVVREKWQLESVITETTFHDLAKLVFALSIFWAYVNWSQFLPIWYAHQPEETHWMVLRLTDPWRPWAFAVISMVWAAPFFLMMTRAAKVNSASRIFFSVVVLAGLWLERFMMIVPTLSPKVVALGPVELVTALGFLGLFLSCFLWYVSRFPVMPVVDPYGGSSAAH